MKLDLNAKYEAVAYTWDTWTFSLKELLGFGKKTILYFYPKDSTPGCTLENKDFSCLKDEFAKIWIVVIWVSKDSISSHRDFIKSEDLKVDLISDPDLVLHKFFWAYWEKNNYWKIVQGTIRSTFLLDSEWNILKSWKNVKATNHAQKVLKELS